MNLRTYGSLRTEIEIETDTQAEDFVQADEQVNYFNKAIDRAEVIINNLYEDYFLDSTYLSLVSGTSEYSLPSTIFATKIRGVMYRTGGIIYEVRRIRNLRKFLDISLGQQFGQADDYRYFLQNKAFTDITSSSTGGYKLTLVPASRETSSSTMQIWYLRNANRIPLVSAGTQTISDNTVIDIPEFYSFVLQYVKVKIYEKGDPRLDEAVSALVAEEKSMVDALTNMVVDNDDEIEGDMSHYQEHS